MDCYERPRLVLAIGSFGGYRAFGEVMENVDAEISRKGAIYFVEHLGPRKEDIKFFENIGIHLPAAKISNGTDLERGKFYLCPGHLKMKIKRIYTLSIGKDKDGGNLCFRDFEIPLSEIRLFSFNIKKAMKAGYGNDMLITVLSGYDDDGCDFIVQAKERGSKIIIQDPKTAIVGQLPKNAKGAINSGSKHVLGPEEIGYEINEFLSH